MTNGHQGIVADEPYAHSNYNEPGLNCWTMLTIPEHRSGWNYVTQLCRDHLHNANGYMFVDFVEKIWCWTKTQGEPKGVYYKGNSYFVNEDDIKFIKGQEHLILETEECVCWNGEEWVESRMSIDIVKKADVFGLITVPWVGIIHNPTNMPKWFDFGNSPQELMKNPKFQKSLTYCKGLIVFSEHLKQELLKWGGWPCTIEVVYHPTEPSEIKWNAAEALKSNNQRVCFSPIKKTCKNRPCKK